MALMVKDVMSPNMHQVTSRKVDLLVVHTMEAPEKGETAEQIAAFFARPLTKASAHYCLDNNSIVRCVNERNVAWAAPGANHDGVQLEHAGYARQTEADWADSYSRSMMLRSAELASDIVRRHQIPVRFILAPGLAAGLRGVTTHNEVSRAFGLSHHWDPGFSFPMEQYLRDIKKFGLPTSPKSEKDPEPTLKLGDKGWKVAQAERLLNFAGQSIVADGVFDKWTQKGVIGFQKRFGLTPDGIIGPATWRRLWAYRY